MADWDAQLVQAFGLILGRPLDSFERDATYAAYEWDDLRSTEYFWHKDLDLSAFQRQPAADAEFDLGRILTQHGVAAADLVETAGC